MLHPVLSDWFFRLCALSIDLGWLVYMCHSLSLLEMYSGGNVFRHCPLPCNGARLQCMELLLRVSIRLSTPVEVEISKLIVTTDLQRQWPKTCIPHILCKITIHSPPYSLITHTTHYIHPQFDNRPLN